MAKAIVHRHANWKEFGEPWEELLDYDGFLDELDHLSVEYPTKQDFMIRCPLPDHSERTGSCHFSWKPAWTPRRWAVRCFGCGFQGDGIDFLAAMYDQSRKDWLVHQRFTKGDIRDNPPRRRQAPKEAPSPTCSEQEFEAYVEQCHQALRDPRRGAQAWAYCQSRGLRPEDARHYKLGMTVPGEPRISRWRLFRFRVLFPCIGSLEARYVPGLSDPEGETDKYLGKNLLIDRKVPWGLEHLQPDGELVVVEGILDAMACRRHPAYANTIALRGQALHGNDARWLASTGFTSALLALDWNANPDQTTQVARTLTENGIEVALATPLPPGNDLGDLLTRPDDDLRVAVEAAMEVTQ